MNDKLQEIADFIASINKNLKRIEKANSLPKHELARFQNEYSQLIHATIDNINHLTAAIIFNQIKNLNELEWPELRALIDSYTSSPEWEEYKQRINRAVRNGSPVAVFYEILKFKDKMYLIFESCGAQENDAFNFWIKGAIKNEVE